MATIRVVKTCRDCGMPFEITSGQMRWLKAKGLEPFSRCAQCRAAKRSANRKETIRDG